MEIDGMEKGRLFGSWIAYHTPRMARPIRKYFPAGRFGSEDGDPTRPRMRNGRTRMISTIVPSIRPITKKRPDKMCTKNMSVFRDVLTVKWTNRPRKAPIENEACG